MPVRTTGSASGGAWAMYSNGQISQKINFIASGNYQFGVMARGTLLGRVGPRLVLRIDGKAMDSITVNSTTMKLYTMVTDLSVGVHEIALAFDNDQYQPPEDRNVWIDYIRYGLDTQPETVLYLNSPCVTVQIPYGSGTIVLDEISWESEAANQAKAERAASAIFTGLGVQMLPARGLRIEAELMKNVNISAYSANNGLVYASSNGRVETSINFTKSGNYDFELVASGTPAANVYPVVQVWINGISKASLQIKSRTLDRYRATLFIAAGTQKVALAFVNDYYAPPEDRNAVFDSLLIIPPRPIVIGRLSLESETVRIQWEAEVGSKYSIEISEDLASWQSVGSVTASGPICSWTEGMTAQSNSRFYRIKK